jgi:NADPH-dependent F420 reductase
VAEDRPIIAVVGGTGKLGAGLARRLAKAGYAVIIGSRDADRAEQAAAALAADTSGQVTGQANRAAAAAGDIVIVAVPFANQRAILEDVGLAVQGKIVVDTTVPLVPPKVARVQLPPEGSAAGIARAVLGEGVRLVAAFHNVAAHKLIQDVAIDCDVLVFGDQVAAREAVVELAAAMDLRGVHSGPLANAAAAEALTSVLVGINKRYKADGAGIRITGLDPDPATREA